MRRSMRLSMRLSMRGALSEDVESMRSRVALIRERLDAGEYAEARGALAALRAELSRVGLESAHLSWMLAAAMDGLGEWEAALSHAREALELDPLALPYRRSYDLILCHMREALADESRSAREPATPRLYALLVEAGAVDVPSHLAMSKWHLAHDEPREARRILEAVVTLSPAHRGAWSLLAEACDALNEAERAAEARGVFEEIATFEALRRASARV